MLLYFPCLSHPLYITSVTLTHSLFPFFLLSLPLTPPLLPRLYNIRIAAVGAQAFQLAPPLSQSDITSGREFGGGQASHGIIQLTYPETGAVFLSVCVIGHISICARACLCGWVDLVFEWSLWLLERRTVIMLPLFQRLSCDRVMAASFLLSPNSSHPPLHTSLLHTAVISVIIS